MDHKERKSVRRFAALPPNSVLHIAEMGGIENLAPEISRILAEDVSYRLRSLIQVTDGYL